ncbi:MAG: hypothetical protein LWX00_08870 [Spirochaetia bacterium]|nr:hypothetical protein [Spirochaetia bacterium]
MRIAVLTISDDGSSNLDRFAKVAENEFSRGGNHVEIIKDASPQLQYFDFILLLTTPVGFPSKPSKKIREVLKNSGNLIGKRSMVVIFKKGFFLQSLLRNTMTEMEKEGLLVTMGERIANAEQLKAILSSAPLTRR